MSDNNMSQQVQVDISKADDIGCPKCGCLHFISAIRLKRISPILSPTGREELINLQTLLCAQCGFEFGQPLEGE